jgi:hypothetical protein
MRITLDLPDELAEDLRQFEPESARVIAAGLREVKAGGSGQFAGLSRLLEKLAELPSPEEVLALRPDPELQARLGQLLDKNRGEGLTPEEEVEWQRYELIEHLMRMAKARALTRLRPE